MRRLGLILGVANLMLGVMLGLAPVATLAAEAPAGFVVSPAFQQVEVANGQASAQYTLKVRNNTATGQNFQLSVVDFGALDEQGGVAFLGQPATELEHKYGLASWMKLEKSAVFVAAGQMANVVVTIENRPSLAPGGHYGAVLLTAVTDTGAPVKSQVGIKQVLSSLILASKQGGERQMLNLVEQKLNGAFGRLPSMVEHRFQNDGNVHVVPRGVTEVWDPAGKLVLRAAINDGSGAILPESFRRYSAKFTNVGRAWLPGSYTVKTQYRYDGTETTKTYTASFWYMGQVGIWLTIVLATVAIGVLGWLLWRRQRRKA